METNLVRQASATANGEKVRATVSDVTKIAARATANDAKTIADRGMATARASSNA